MANAVQVGDKLQYYGLTDRHITVLEIFEDGDRAKFRRWDGVIIYGWISLCPKITDPVTP